MYKLLENGVLPKIKTKFSSSADLCSRIDISIRPGETAIIPLGVTIDLEEVKKCFIEDIKEKDKKAKMPPYSNVALEEMWESFQKSNYFALKIRSSLSFHLNIANGEGEIDIDYPKEIGLIVHNPLRLKEGVNEIDFDKVVEIKAGMPVAQIKLVPHHNYLLSNKYRTDEVRVGGYGSTT